MSDRKLSGVRGVKTTSVSIDIPVYWDICCHWPGLLTISWRTIENIQNSPVTALLLCNSIRQREDGGEPSTVQAPTISVRPLDNFASLWSQAGRRERPNLIKLVRLELCYCSVEAGKLPQHNSQSGESAYKQPSTVVTGCLHITARQLDNVDWGKCKKSQISAMLYSWGDSHWWSRGRGVCQWLPCEPLSTRRES